MTIKEAIKELENLLHDEGMTQEQKALHLAINILENLNEERILSVIKNLADRQFGAIVSAVNKKGLMNTDWCDIDKEGGSLDFNIIAQAIIQDLTKEIE